MITNLIVVIILQYIHISNHIVHPNLHKLYVNNTTMKWTKSRKDETEDPS